MLPIKIMAERMEVKMNSKLIMKKLSNQDITTIFHGDMQTDFPANEIKPLSLILTLSDQGVYPCFGLFENDIPCGYAFCCKSKDNNLLLLDYLAIQREYRSRGFGSIFLTYLKETCIEFDGIIIEVESTEGDIPDEELLTRKRRIAFYEKNNVLMTSHSAIVRDVLFQLMYLPCRAELNSFDFIKETENIYSTLFLGEHCFIFIS